MIKGFYQYINESYSNFRNIRYGNPTRDQKESMDRGSDILRMVEKNGMLSKWKSKNPPDQGSEEARKSIENLILLSNSLTGEDLAFIKNAEEDFVGLFLNFLKSNNIDTIGRIDIETELKRIESISFILKYHFNYPRPVQLSLELDLPLYPPQSTDACSPSYPSMHTIDSFVISGLIGKKIPQLYDSANSLAEKISFSRNQGGIHFKFDSDFGKEIARDILSLDILSL